jgi:oligopeptide/dipeptide ABC transporter ATP-binding protein
LSPGPGGAIALEVEGLEVSFADRGGRLAWAVRGIDLFLGESESLAIVGESGSGKTAAAKALLRLHDPRTTAVSGRILIGGRDVSAASEREMEGIRGRLASMVFQDPMTSLNPVLRVGDQVAEAVSRSRGVGAGEARRVALELFGKAGMPSPDALYKRYPHEFSGGMLQRAMILIALAASPKLLIADEPTTALDVTVQAQVLDLIEAERLELGTALLLVSHDIGVVAERAERACVMYGGRVVESGDTADILASPLHPYTEGLLDALPGRGARGERFRTIEGSGPSVYDQGGGCPFAPRCRYVQEPCLASVPALEPAAPLGAAASGPSLGAAAMSGAVAKVGAARRAACRRAGELSLRGIA